MARCSRRSEELLEPIGVIWSLQYYDLLYCPPAKMSPSSLTAAIMTPMRTAISMINCQTGFFFLFLFFFFFFAIRAGGFTEASVGGQW